MTDINELLSRIDALIKQRKVARSTVSRKLFGSGTRLDQIANGDGDVSYRVISKASERLNQLERGV